MRGLRIFLIIVVVLGGIFVAVDRIAVNVAENKAAEKIKSSQGLNSTPDVSIKGFPFLTQVLGSELDEVDVKLSGITASAEGRSVQLTEVRAELMNVKIDSSFSSAVAASATGSARISYADLTKSAPKGATVSYAGAERAAKGQVKVTGSISDLLAGSGVSVPESLKALPPLTTYSTVKLEGGDHVKLHADALPALVESRLRKVVDYDLKLDGLPSSIKLDRTTAVEDGIEFSGTGTDVSLAG
ncbi:DUF2993 domain-containing protein [Streptomyces sp. NPDC050738]|uniref:LmeA family phospholipid-binding protein n=1 Tax=Streptomyces sp. NPDC050738 TaxID=3154744 RepID=UPI00341AE4C5